MSMKGDHGRLLGVRPNLLVVPPSLESAGLKILNSERRPVARPTNGRGLQSFWLRPGWRKVDLNHKQFES